MNRVIKRFYCNTNGYINISLDLAIQVKQLDICANSYLKIKIIVRYVYRSNDWPNIANTLKWCKNMRAPFNNMDQLKHQHGYVITSIITCGMELLTGIKSPTLFWACDYISMLGWKLIHVDKGDLVYQSITYLHRCSLHGPTIINMMCPWKNQPNKKHQMPWALYQINKIAGCACAGNAGNVSPPPTSKETAS